MVKQSFRILPGLPAQDDPEVKELMAVVGRMPRENLEEIAHSLLRCAAGYERTGDAGYLTNLATDSLVTLRLQSDPDCEKALSEAPDHPQAPPPLST